MRRNSWRFGRKALQVRAAGVCGRAVFLFLALQIRRRMDPCTRISSLNTQLSPYKSTQSDSKQPSRANEDPLSDDARICFLGVVRAAVAAKLLDNRRVSRLAYVGPMFRRERPQHGRYRQVTFISLAFNQSAASRLLLLDLAAAFFYCIYNHWILTLSTSYSPLLSLTGASTATQTL